VPIASGSHADAVVSMGSATSTLWGSLLAAGTSRPLPDGELLHVYLARGILDAEAIGPLEAGDSLRLSGHTQLRLTARVEAEVLVWQMDREQGGLR